MKHYLIATVAVLAAMSTARAQDNSYPIPEDLQVKTFTLSNGMTVWINEDHNQPKAFGAVVVKAGAKDCPGTGIAHYFEHMMFKGTEKIGTTDYAAEKPYLDSIADLYDRLALSESDSVRTDIQMEINRLNIKASDYAIPNEFNNLISECGGSNLNAYTSMDVTVYHNEFIPAYFEQWAELCSERLIDPVFRLFQSELETVYEEKNRSENQQMSAFSNMITAEGFKGCAYQYPVIGTTENLKNPRLSQMAKFFEDYYVAGNMGLMLTGDIDAAAALPVLEKTFGRIRRGEAPVSDFGTVREFSGRQSVEALVKVPVIKLSALCYRAPSSKEEDCQGLSFLAFMLNNSEGTGLLDKLTTDHKLMAAICLYPGLAFKDAGMFPILIMPKLLFQRSKKAEQRATEVLDALKAGDFSDEYFESCKLTYRRNLISMVESVEERMDAMVDAFQNDRTWEEEVSQVDRIDRLTKADLVALANKYLGPDYLVINKKFGDPEKDNLQKPPYKKVVPKHSGESSAYARSIKEASARVALPRAVVDFDADACQSRIGECVNVYSVANPLNDVFSLTIEYPVGTLEFPAAERMAGYVNLLGTRTMSYDDHRAALQAVGGSISMSAGATSFSINVSGFDDKFDQVLSLAADLIKAPEGDKKKLSIIKENEMMSDIMSKREAGEIFAALRQFVLYGKNSSYLADKGKINDNVLLGLYEQIRDFECDVHYTGNLSHEALVLALKKNLDLDRSEKAHPNYYAENLELPAGPRVFFFDKKKATQSNISAFVPGDCMEDLPTRFLSNAFGEYFGGGMGSVMFQEIREYRSMAYSAGAVYSKPQFCNRGTIPGYLRAQVGTQCDKTIDAMEVMDSLIHNTPFTRKRVDMVKKDLWCDEVTGYPDYRSISGYIATQRRSGYETDPASEFYDLIGQLDSDALKTFWASTVKPRSIVWVVVGDSKKIDMEGLSKFGPVTTVKTNDIFK